MAPQTPEQVVEQLGEAIADRDLDRAVALYEPEATFAPQPDHVISGLDAIREAVAAFIATEPELTGEITKVLTAGDTALVQNRWELRGRQPDGSPVEMSGVSADVVRRQPDGSWRVLIDDPWGAAG
jgi:uncharacterized protein (TIGR02246 family)